MRPAALALLFALALPATVRASLAEAIAAHRLLADIAEARVLRIEWRAKAGGERPVIHALVFSFEGLTWFYAPEIGTRVLGPAAAAWPDAPEFTRRLQQFDAAIQRVTVHPQPVAPEAGRDQLELNNACVIASLAALTNLLARQGDVHEAGLVLLSYDTADAATADAMFVNHCLLVFRERDQWRCIDPRAPAEAFALEQIRVGAPLDPALLRVALHRRYPLKSARLLALSPGTLRQLNDSALWRAVTAARLSVR